MREWEGREGGREGGGGREKWEQKVVKRFSCAYSVALNCTNVLFVGTNTFISFSTLLQGEQWRQFTDK